jgi:hypothetical protein
MHRIDSRGATLDNKFTDGDVTQGIPATVVDAEWLNSVQEEIVGVISAAGIGLDKNNNSQLIAAITALSTLQTRTLHPVGSLYFNASDDRNPSVLLGFGSWIRVASGRVLFGFDAADTDFDAAGKTGGSKTHTHATTVSLAGGHNHGGATGLAGEHNHTNQTGVAGSHSHSGNSGFAGTHAHSLTSNGAFTPTITIASGGAHSHGGATGEHTLTVDQIPSHTHIQNGSNDGAPFVYGFQMDGNNTNTPVFSGIPTQATGGSQSHSHTISSDAGHTHSASSNTIPDHTHTVLDNGNHRHAIEADGNHWHTIPTQAAHSHSIADVADHTHTVGVDTRSNLPPYFTVHIWQRTA